MNTHPTASADLARVHGLISDLFRTPTTSQEWDSYRLTADQVSSFHENGYLAGIRMLDDRQIVVLREELADLSSPLFPGNDLFYEYHSNESSNPESVLFHALGAWRITPGFHDILWNPAFVMAASQLLGGSVRFWHDQLFCKPSRHGGVVSWHQDYSYWTRTKPMAHLTCWTGLDDADTSNGCLYYIPGSHRWGLLDKPELAGDMNGIMSFLTDEQKRQFQPVPIELKAGYAAFHHPLMVHGSYENRSNRPRRAFVLNVFRDGVVSDSNDELLASVPPIPKGEKMQGDFFPLLYPI
jgi:ectoine hydroxylase-related dioxygenase (phytanoyl-CoA dioxygenase family)